ncbi:hypothetical protein PRK78_001573 [Emydomyces testavorans]|uniref:Uncharacterized protein n=1 Tax=Emydomyces testavorans TaxID=2070801 RepID=A0AAF0DD78_9EURO|nr:hypothetical protein PRK78_001573 [Emydomyces testavorans]
MEGGRITYQLALRRRNEDVGICLVGAPYVSVCKPDSSQSYIPHLRAQFLEEQEQQKGLKQQMERKERKKPGAGAYYFAKRSINADRLSRHEASQRAKQEAARQEAEARVSSSTTTSKPPLPVPPTPSPSSVNETRSTAGGGKLSKSMSADMFGRDDVGSPSQEMGHDPAATRHEPETEAQRVAEKGKYEATQLFRSRKGDRFS